MIGGIWTAILAHASDPQFDEALTARLAAAGSDRLVLLAWSEFGGRDRIWAALDGDESLGWRTRVARILSTDAAAGAEARLRRLRLECGLLVGGGTLVPVGQCAPVHGPTDPGCRVSPELGPPFDAEVQVFGGKRGGTCAELAAVVQVGMNLVPIESALPAALGGHALAELEGQSAKDVLSRWTLDVLLAWEPWARDGMAEVLTTPEGWEVVVLRSVVATGGGSTRQVAQVVRFSEDGVLLSQPPPPLAPAFQEGCAADYQLVLERNPSLPWFVGAGTAGAGTSGFSAAIVVGETGAFTQTGAGVSAASSSNDPPPVDADDNNDTYFAAGVATGVAGVGLSIAGAGVAAHQSGQRRARDLIRQAQLGAGPELYRAALLLDATALATGEAVLRLDAHRAFCADPGHPDTWAEALIRIGGELRRTGTGVVPPPTFGLP